MHLSRLALAPAVVLFVAACSGGGPATTSPAAPTPAAPTASASPGSSRLEVKLTDALRIEPAEMTVPAGVAVTFVVTNSGSTDHEFYLGDEEAQAEHEKKMASGGMTHTEPAGIALEPGETKELTYTFEAPGETLSGCHVAGHYGGGMKALITVSD